MKEDPSLWWIETAGEIVAYAETGDLESAVESFAALCDYARDVTWPAHAASHIGTSALRVVEACCRRGRLETALKVYEGLRELGDGRKEPDLRMETARCAYVVVRLSRGIHTADHLSLFKTFVTDIENDQGLVDAVSLVAGEVEALLRAREEDDSAEMRTATVHATKAVRSGVELVLVKCPYCEQGLLVPRSRGQKVFLCQTCLRRFVLKDGS